MDASGLLAPKNIAADVAVEGGVPAAGGRRALIRQLPAICAAPAARCLDYLELTKPRINILVLLVTGVGFFLAAADAPGAALLIRCLIGTALLGAGSSALNQLLERRHDARMTRTYERPLPARRLHAWEVGALGLGLGLAGLLVLLAGVNPTSALLGFITFTSYAFLYTPLKRWTWLSLYAGAVPGALPPLIGWTAAGGSLSPASPAWAIFAILFFWQIPHFYAIAWLYREDYRAAGFAISRVLESSGRSLARQVDWNTAMLLIASALPAWIGLAGPYYAWGALVLGAGFFGAVRRFARLKTAARARHALFASLIYLPALFVLLFLDRI